MKKIILLFVMSCFIGLVIRWSLEEKDRGEIKDFKIFRSYIQTSGSYKQTYLKVIVNEKEYILADLYNNIRDFQENLNGESDELTITIYKSKKDLLNGKALDEEIFYKDKHES